MNLKAVKENVLLFPEAQVRYYDRFAIKMLNIRNMIKKLTFGEHGIILICVPDYSLNTIKNQCKHYYHQFYEIK